MFHDACKIFSRPLPDVMSRPRNSFQSSFKRSCNEQKRVVENYFLERIRREQPRLNIYIYIYSPPWRNPLAFICTLIVKMPGISEQCIRQHTCSRRSRIIACRSYEWIWKILNEFPVAYGRRRLVRQYIETSTIRAHHRATIRSWVDTVGKRERSTDNRARSDSRCVCALQRVYHRACIGHACVHSSRFWYNIANWVQRKQFILASGAESPNRPPPSLSPPSLSYARIYFSVILICALGIFYHRICIRITAGAM